MSNQKEKARLRFWKDAFLTEDSRVSARRIKKDVRALEEDFSLSKSPEEALSSFYEKNGIRPEKETQKKRSFGGKLLWSAGSAAAICLCAVCLFAFGSIFMKGRKNAEYDQTGKEIEGHFTKGEETHRNGESFVFTVQEQDGSAETAVTFSNMNPDHELYSEITSFIASNDLPERQTGEFTVVFEVNGVDYSAGLSSEEEAEQSDHPFFALWRRVREYCRTHEGEDFRPVQP